MNVLNWSSSLLLVVFLFGASCRFEFTNINCTALDKEFMGFDACRLKSINRTYKYLTVRTKIHQLPFNDLLVRAEVLKWTNGGYRPFLYNFTAEICQFFKGKRNPVTKFFYELFGSFSNLNHTCPYNHDIFVEKLSIGFLNHRLTVIIPLPEGDYCVHSVWTVRGKQVMDLRVNVRLD